MSAKQEIMSKIEEMRRIVQDDELEHPYFLSDGYLLSWLEEKRFQVLKAVQRYRETMAWRKERHLKEMSLNNGFALAREMDDRIGVDRQGRPVFVHCPTIDNLDQIFGDEMDVDLNKVKNIQDIKKGVEQIEKHHNQNLSDNFNHGRKDADVFAEYKESVIRAGRMYLERILVTIKECDSDFGGGDEEDPRKRIRSAILILDFSHYRVLAELAENLEDLKFAWQYIPKLLTICTEGYELLKTNYPGLVHEVYLLNVPKRLSRVMLFLAKPYIRADWLGKLKIFGRKRYKWNKVLAEKIGPGEMQRLFSNARN